VWRGSRAPVKSARQRTPGPTRNGPGAAARGVTAVPLSRKVILPQFSPDVQIQEYRDSSKFRAYLGRRKRV
jgi:hypothetical protein